MDKLQRFIQIFFNNELITTVVPALAAFVIVAWVAQKFVLPKLQTSVARNMVNAVIAIVFLVSAFISYKAFV